MVCTHYSSLSCTIYLQFIRRKTESMKRAFMNLFNVEFTNQILVSPEVAATFTTTDKQVNIRKIASKMKGCTRITKSDLNFFAGTPWDTAVMRFTLPCSPPFSFLFSLSSPSCSYSLQQTHAALLTIIL